MNDLQDTSYADLVSRIALSVRAMESYQLQQRFDLGRHVDEFLQATLQGRFNGAPLEALAHDLMQQGVMLNLTDPVRALRQCRSLYQLHQNSEAFMLSLVAVGYTHSHAIILMTVPEAMRAQALADCVQDNVIVSVREMARICQELRGITGAGIQEAQVEDMANASIELDASPAPATGASQPVLGPQPIPPIVDTPGNPELPTPAPTTAPEGANTGTIREMSLSPNKVLGGLEKALGKVLIAVPDAFIAVREAAQVGFDSDTAQTRYLTSLRQVRQAVVDVKAPLDELLQTIDGELGAVDG